MFVKPPSFIALDQLDCTTNGFSPIQSLDLCSRYRLACTNSDFNSIEQWAQMLKRSKFTFGGMSACFKRLIHFWSNNDQSLLVRRFVRLLTFIALDQQDWSIYCHSVPWQNAHVNGREAINRAEPVGISVGLGRKFRCLVQSIIRKGTNITKVRKLTSTQDESTEVLMLKIRPIQIKWWRFASTLGCGLAFGLACGLARGLTFCLWLALGLHFRHLNKPFWLLA